MITTQLYWFRGNWCFSVIWKELYLQVTWAAGEEHFFPLLFFSFYFASGNRKKSNNKLQLFADFFDWIKRGFYTAINIKLPTTEEVFAIVNSSHFFPENWFINHLSPSRGRGKGRLFINNKQYHDQTYMALCQVQHELIEKRGTINFRKLIQHSDIESDEFPKMYYTELYNILS